MDLIPVTASPADSNRCAARARCMVRVKFVSLPPEYEPGAALRGQRASGLARFISRVIGRLVAARP
jgi:hypothetical protein